MPELSPNGLEDIRQRRTQDKNKETEPAKITKRARLGMTENQVGEESLDTADKRQGGVNRRGVIRRKGQVGNPVLPVSS